MGRKSQTLWRFDRGATPSNCTLVVVIFISRCIRIAIWLLIFRNHLYFRITLSLFHSLLPVNVLLSDQLDIPTEEDKVLMIHQKSR